MHPQVVKHLQQQAMYLALLPPTCIVQLIAKLSALLCWGDMPFNPCR